MSLNSKQIRFLKAEAHRRKMKPIVMIGQKGLTENVIEEINQALSYHELIKVRLPAMDSDERETWLQQLASSTSAEVFGRIGHICLMYRLNPDKQQYKFPAE